MIGRLEASQLVHEGFELADVEGPVTILIVALEDGGGLGPQR